MKISLPKYYGGEAIGTYLKFLQEILLYFINYNMMTPDADTHRVSVLGSALEERALKWYQQMIHMNADGRWSFEGAMIELKRHFVKDASARDVAAKFDCLTQRDRTVTNLRKELEGLTMQMVEVPMEYDMSHRFMKAIKPEIASTVARYGVNPKNSRFDAIFETAKSIKQGIYYEESQRNEFGTSKSTTGSLKKTSPKVTSTKPSAGPVKKGSVYMKPMVKGDATLKRASPS